MKKNNVVCLVVAIMLCGSVQASLTWQQVDFTNMIEGVVSYNASGGNVVVEDDALNGIVGTAFGNYSKLTSVQTIGNDGTNNPVSGNFGMYGVFSYTDAAGVLGWAMANSNTTLALEIRARGVQFDTNLNGTFDGDDFVDNYVLDATDASEPYLAATFAELAEWGCTEIADGVWLDIAIQATDETSGYVALSVVIDGFVLHDGLVPSFDANLLAGPLGGYIPGYVKGSGIRVAAIPVPGAMILGGIGVGVVGWMRRRRSL